MRVFIDSDVIISSLISSKGAAFILLNNPNVLKLISNYSILEIDEVIERLKLSQTQFNELTQQHLVLTEMEMTLNEIKSKFGDYVMDIDDAHIIAGAKIAKVKFLITYNLRHFKIDRIKKELGIIVITPGMFLQYLRSIS